jgi:hypothetical protein
LRRSTLNLRVAWCWTSAYARSAAPSFRCQVRCGRHAPANRPRSGARICRNPFATNGGRRAVTAAQRVEQVRYGKETMRLGNWQFAERKANFLAAGCGSTAKCTKPVPYNEFDWSTDSCRPAATTPPPPETPATAPPGTAAATTP